MGTGIGICCERCGKQLNYDDGFVLRKEGYDFNLCKKCNSFYEFKKKENIKLEKKLKSHKIK